MHRRAIADPPKAGRAISVAAPVSVMGVLLGFVALGCFRFTEEPARTFTADSGVDATLDVSTETAVDTGGGETAPTMCDRYGGYPTVQKAMADLVPVLQADCRVDRFFTALSADKTLHMQECMALQLGSIMRCSRDGVRVKYPGTDSKGVLCRDMKGSHQGLGIWNEDFDALIDDTLSVLAAAKMTPEDIATVADILRFERTDIVNPGDAGRGDACMSETSGGDTGAVDTGDPGY